MSDCTITINHRGAIRLRGGHPWVYRSDLVGVADAAPGALVSVCDGRGRRLGSALYSSASQIAIRLLSSEDISEKALPDLLRTRIARAVQFRQPIDNESDSCRVVFSEADLLPGLIVDKYNDVISLQAQTQAFDRDDLRELVVESLAEHFPAASLVERVDSHIRELEQLTARESQLVRGERSRPSSRSTVCGFTSTRSAGRRLARFSISARTTPRRRVMRTAGARRLHLSGRICAAPGADLR